MNWMTGLFVFLFLLLTTMTFLIWLKPPRFFRGEARLDLYPIAAAVFAVLFFLACFVLGVWFSVLRIRGDLWML